MNIRKEMCLSLFIISPYLIFVFKCIFIYTYMHIHITFFHKWNFSASYVKSENMQEPKLYKHRKSIIIYCYI